jgi:DNA-binding beta-propeller fold protein YncE
MKRGRHGDAIVAHRASRTPWRVVGLIALVIAVASSSSPGVSAPTRAWVARYNGPANACDISRAVATSPDGSTVFVTGGSRASATGMDFETLAYDAVDGSPLWQARFGAAKSQHGDAIAVSPDGNHVFVSGPTGVASYAASDGTVEWSLGGTSHDLGRIRSFIEVSPDGSRLYWAVLGSVEALDAATGALQWSKDIGELEMHALAVSLDGSRVFVVNSEFFSSSDFSTGLTALRASDGAIDWAKTLSLANTSYTLAMSPLGGRLFLSYHQGQYGRTLAYRVGGGPRLWVIPSGGTSLTASQDGGLFEASGGSAYRITALSTKAGLHLWTRTFGAEIDGHDDPTGIVLGPSEKRLYVTGRTTTKRGDLDFGTVALKPSGSRTWVSHYNGPGHALDAAMAITTGPDGNVFVTGESEGVTSSCDYASVALS